MTRILTYFYEFVLLRPYLYPLSAEVLYTWVIDIVQKFDSLNDEEEQNTSSVRFHFVLGSVQVTTMTCIAFWIF